MVNKSGKITVCTVVQSASPVQLLVGWYNGGLAFWTWRFLSAHVAMYFFKNVCWLAGWLLAGWLAGFVRLHAGSFFSFCFFAKTQEDNKRRVHQVQLSTRTDLLLSATAASPPASAAFLKSLQNFFFDFFFFLFIFYRRKASAGLQCVEKRKKKSKRLRAELV